MISLHSAFVGLYDETSKLSSGHVIVVISPDFVSFGFDWKYALSIIN